MRIIRKTYRFEDVKCDGTYKTIWEDTDENINDILDKICLNECVTEDKIINVDVNVTYEDISQYVKYYYVSIQMIVRD